MNRTFFRATALIVLTSLLGLGCKGTPPDVQSRYKPVTLNYWRVFDDVDDFQGIISGYTATHPNVKIIYKKLRPEEYEKALLEAFAEDRGPDIFSIHNTWVSGYEKKITPMPKTLEIPKVVEQGTIKKEKVVVLDKKNTPKITDIKKAFVSVVVDDVIRDMVVDPKTEKFEKQVLGLPYSVDTMVLFYNEDLLAQAGIATPPKDWKELHNTVKPLTRIGTDDTILQSAVALGTANNVNRAADIVSLLMMQDGAKMTDQFGRATFDQMPPEIANQPDRNLAPGIEALIFYTEFANPLEPVYTWNAKLPESFDAFADGKTAFFFGYNYHIPLLAARAPKLRYSYAPMLQTDPDYRVNYASYWVETVSKKTKYTNEAWDFILYATQKEPVKKYLEKTKRPTALITMIDEQKQDPQLEPFASQLLTAKSWYRGKDPAALDVIFRDMIEEALANAPIDPKQAFENAISRGVRRVNQTME